MRKDRPLNTPDGRKVREFQLSSMNEREKREIEDKAMEEERKMRENEGC